MILPIETHSENLERVNATIGQSVLTFAKMNLGRVFHADDLFNFVCKNTDAHVAPNSPYRILYELSRKRDAEDKPKIKYKLIDRRKSLFKIVEVR